jgi:hypothetical protein
MAITLASTHRTSGGTGTTSSSMSTSAEGYDLREMLLPPATTNKEVDVDFPFASLLEFHATVDDLDDNVTITLRTNSTGAPGDTKTFKTPGAIHYKIDANGANFNSAAAPFTADVTRIYASNPSTTQTGRLRLEWLYDPTP